VGRKTAHSRPSGLRSSTFWARPARRREGLPEPGRGIELYRVMVLVTLGRWRSLRTHPNAPDAAVPSSKGHTRRSCYTGPPSSSLTRPNPHKTYSRPFLSNITPLAFFDVFAYSAACFFVVSRCALIVNLWRIRQVHCSTRTTASIFASIYEMRHAPNFARILDESRRHVDTTTNTV
jgi:hypothetical protein